jgi:hypothetical protein
MNNTMLLMLSVTLLGTLTSKGQPTGTKLSKLLIHNTVRIIAQGKEGTEIGTGFFYQFAFHGKLQMPVLITCSHVIAGSTNGQLLLSAKGKDGTRGTNTVMLTITNFEANWIKHPDGKTDLAILPIISIFPQIVNQTGTNIFEPDFSSLTDELIIQDSETTNAGVCINVKMIGYPIGIWDSKNNLPIVRTGTTATDICTDYNGQPEFLVDIAIFPGSSGSPIVYEDDGRNPFYVGGFESGPRLKLLGVAAQTFLYPASGGVQAIPIPTKFNLRANVDMPANLAIIIKAQKILEFKPIIESLTR